MLGEKYKMEKFLVVNNIKKSFKDKLVLDGINFSIEKNEIVGLLGKNGSGKSTLMKIIAGLQNPKDGKIEITGFDISKNREKALENLGISIESPALYQSLTGLENLKLMANWTDSSMDRVAEVVDYVGIGHKINSKTSTYSMGMKMRLMLGMVIMSKPKMIVLDEPMNGLDPEGVFQLRRELFELKKEGCAILLSSHQLSEVEKISDRILMLEGGKIIYDDKLYTNISKNSYSVFTNDYKTTWEVLKSINCDIKVPEDINLKGYIDISLDEKNLNDLFKLLNKQDIKILDIIKTNITLEELYKKLRKK